MDLSHLNQVKVDAEKRLAFLQGGALWSDFNTATAKHGFACVSGTVDHTGVGGLITGGGYGFLSGQYGLVIDNLVEATVVVADGRIVKASETENPDLFWGIRGLILRQSIVNDQGVAQISESFMNLCFAFIHIKEPVLAASWSSLQIKSTKLSRHSTGFGIKSSRIAPVISSSARYLQQIRYLTAGNL